MMTIADQISLIREVRFTWRRPLAPIMHGSHKVLADRSGLCSCGSAGTGCRGPCGINAGANLARMFMEENTWTRWDSIKLTAWRVWRWPFSLRHWKMTLACSRDLGRMNETDSDSLLVDLELAVELLQEARVADADGLPFKACSLACEAIHLTRSAIGIRVWPPMYGQGMFTLWQHLFGYRAPSSPETAGKRPLTRLYKDG